MVGERSCSGEDYPVRGIGVAVSENAGMSKRLEVRIFHAVCARFPKQRSSTSGKSDLRRVRQLAE